MMRWERKPQGQGRIRRWIEAVYAFDDRLHNRMSTSPRYFAVLMAVTLFLSFGLGVLLFIFGWRHGETLVVIPASAAACGAVPGIWLGRRRYRQVMTEKRRTAGQCLTCGYDLRASQDRCPECGTGIHGEANVVTPGQREEVG